MPKGFSQELADRLTNSSNFKSSLVFSAEKTAKPETPATLPTVDKKPIESQSSILVSSSSILESPEPGSGIVLTLSSRLRELHLKKWSLSDVVDVLKVNGCAVYSNMFIKKVRAILWKITIIIVYFLEKYI